MGGWSVKPVTLDAIEFDGDSVVFEVSRLKVEDMQALNRFYDKEAGTIRFTEPLEVSAMAAQILPKYVVAMHGLKLQDGAEMDVATFLTASQELYFVALVAQLFAKLISVSVMQQGERKN